MTQAGPIVQAVLLETDGAAREVTLDMTPKAVSPFKQQQACAAYAVQRCTFAELRRVLHFMV